MSENNEIEVASESGVQNGIANLVSGQKTIFSTFDGDDFEVQFKLLDGISNSLPISENLDTPIQIDNLIVKAVELVEESTGNIVTQPRLIVLSPDGTAYHATSPTLFRQFQDMLELAGKPSTWEKPIYATFTKEKAKTGYFFKAKFSL